MREVWFIRHGQSVSNANLITEDAAGSALTEQGEAEARQIVSAIPRKPAVVLLSSFLRARQTAQPTLDHFAPVATEEWPIQEFTYLSDDKYRGKRMEDRIPFARSYWQKEDPHYEDDGVAESFATFVARLHQVKAQMLAHEASFMVAFSHGLFIRGLMWAVTSAHVEATAEGFRSYRSFFRTVATPNGAICKFSLSEDRIRLTGLDSSHMVK